ncbi:hypothetical protein ACS0TY_022890 [Phlomoides rotata]
MGEEIGDSPPRCHPYLVGYFSESIGRTLGNFMGCFLEYDASNVNAVWREYMRIRVDIDIDLSLKRCKKIKLGTSATILVSFKYEKLISFCFICGRLGHTESFCDVLFNYEDGNVKCEWGTFFRAPDRRIALAHGDLWLRKRSSIDREKTIIERAPEGDEFAVDGASQWNFNVGEMRQTVHSTTVGNKHAVCNKELVVVGNPIYVSHEEYGKEGTDFFALTDCKKRKPIMEEPVQNEESEVAGNKASYFLEVGSASQAHIQS